MRDLSYYNLYSFCKSNAISYGYLVWALAYQKCYNPKQFWVSVLNHACSMYRPWVHVQEAKLAGWRLDFGRPPFKPNGDQLLPSDYRPFLYNDGWHQYKERGYWISNRFMPGTFLRCEGDKIMFRGLIATGRHYQDLTFVKIGWETGRYIDVVIRGTHAYDRHDILAGDGRLERLFDGPRIKAQNFTFQKASD